MPLQHSDQHRWPDYTYLVATRTAPGHRPRLRAGGLPLARACSASRHRRGRAVALTDAPAHAVVPLSELMLHLGSGGLRSPFCSAAMAIAKP